MFQPFYFFYFLLQPFYFCYRAVLAAVIPRFFPIPERLGRRRFSSFTLKSMLPRFIFGAGGIRCTQPIGSDIIIARRVGSFSIRRPVGWCATAASS